jgi:hypothetical protein
MDGQLPLTASDLREIADALDPIETLTKFTENPVIGRIEVIRPGGDADDIAGYFVREGEPGSGDTWFGFRQEKK